MGGRYKNCPRILNPWPLSTIQRKQSILSLSFFSGYTDWVLFLPCSCSILCQWKHRCHRKPTQLELLWYRLMGKDAQREVLKQSWQSGRGVSRAEDLERAAMILEKIYDIRSESLFYGYPDRQKVHPLTFHGRPTSMYVGLMNTTEIKEGKA